MITPLLGMWGTADDSEKKYLRSSLVEKTFIHDTDQSPHVPCIRGPKHVRRFSWTTRRRKYKAEAAAEDVSQSAKVEPT